MLNVAKSLVILAVMIMFVTSCSKDSSEPKPDTGKSKSDKDLQKASAPFRCSDNRPNTLKSFSSGGNVTLSPGKYAVKYTKNNQYVGTNPFYFYVVSGNVTTRSVLEDVGTFSVNWSLKDLCVTMTAGDQRWMGPNAINAPWDNLYYEFIVNTTSQVAWQGPADF